MPPAPITAMCIRSSASGLWVDIADGIVSELHSMYTIACIVEVQCSLCGTQTARSKWIARRMRQNSGKRWVGALVWAIGVAMLAKGNGYAQPPPTGGEVITPGSRMEQPSSTGVRAHTNIQIFIPNRRAAAPPSSSRGNGGRAAIDHSPQPLETTATGAIVRPQ